MLLKTEYFELICEFLGEKVALEEVKVQSFGVVQKFGIEKGIPLINDIIAEYRDYINTEEVKGKSIGNSVKTPALGDLLIKQGEKFCRNIWPELSIRGIFV